MPYPCSGAPPGSLCNSSKASYTEYEFETGKTYRLRVVNTGAAGIQYFTIDGYELTVVAIDFVEIEPYNTTTVILGVSRIRACSWIFCVVLNFLPGRSTLGCSVHSNHQIF
jgi:hypothetical protein